MGRSRAALVAALASAALVSIAFAQHARGATYKWVDEKGVTHYSDKLPADAVNRGSTVLDRQAMPLKKVDPVSPADLAKAKPVDAERAQELAKQQEAQARRDRALMQSYASESEIDLARNRALMTLDAQIEAAAAFSVQLEKRREVLLERKAKLGDKPLPAAEEREFETTTAEIAKQHALLQQKQKEREATVARYAADKARWRELRPGPTAKDAPPPAARSAVPGVLPASGAAPAR